MKFYFSLFLSFCCAFARAQTRKISGTVMDEVKAPLAGVTVALSNGRSLTKLIRQVDFQLTLLRTSNVKLVFTYTGYVSQTVAAV